MNTNEIQVGDQVCIPGKYYNLVVREIFRGKGGRMVRAEFLSGYGWVEFHICNFKKAGA